MNPMIITNKQGGGVDEGKSMTASIEALQIGTQGSQHGRHQDYKPLITHQFRKLASQVLANMFRVIGFEVSILRLMKVNNDRHDLTHTQLATPAAFFTPIFDSSALPER